jgi:hypothetical protein
MAKFPTEIAPIDREVKKLNLCKGLSDYPIKNLVVVA